MAWKEILLAGGLTLAGVAGKAYISSEAQGAAESEIEKGLEPFSEKLDRIEASQLRIEGWHILHLEDHD